MKLATKLLLTIALVAFPHSFIAAPTPQPNIDVKGYYSNDKAQRGQHGARRDCHRDSLGLSREREPPAGQVRDSHNFED